MVRRTSWLAAIGLALSSAFLFPRPACAGEGRASAAVRPGRATANRNSANRAATATRQIRSEEARVLAGAPLAPLAQFYPADGLGGGTSGPRDTSGAVYTTLYGTAANSVAMTGYFSQGPAYPWAYGMNRRNVYSPGFGGFSGFGAPFFYGYGYPYASGWFGIPYTYAAYGYPYSSFLQPSYAYYGYAWPGGTGLYAPPTYFGYGGYGLPLGYYGYSGFSGYGGYVGMGPYGGPGGAYYW